MIIIVILAHKNPAQFAKLCEYLQHPEIRIYAHICGNAEINEFTALNPPCHFIEHRIPVTWGDYSQIKATLNSIEEVLKKEETFTHLTLLSGQDFPIKPSNDFVHFLKAHPNNDFINIREISRNDWNVSHRYSRFRFKNRFLDILSILSPIRRSHPNSRVYGGSQWWILSRTSIQYVHNYQKAHAEYLQFYKYTSCCDEMFFQTLLMNSPQQQQIVNNNYRYIDWSEKKKSPKVLTDEDFDSVISSEHFFCRKIDSFINDKIITLLEQQIKKNS